MLCGGISTLEDARKASLHDLLNGKRMPQGESGDGKMRFDNGSVWRDSDFERDANGQIRTDKDGRPIVKQSVLREVEQERKSIRDDAVKRGLIKTDENGKEYAVAPNGERSKLTVNQWVEVRTKRFKEWFGDWETATTANHLLEGEPVANLTGNEFLAKPGMTFVEQVVDYFNKSGGKASSAFGVVLLDRKGIKNSKGHGMSRTKAAAFSSVKEVLENGVVVLPLDYHMVHGKKQKTGMIAAPITIGGERYVCIVEVIENSKDKRLYVHEAFSRKNLQGLVASSQVRGGNSSSPQGLGEIAKVLQDIVTTKENSSKIVDENGEPLVVYRGDKRGSYVMDNAQGSYHASAKDVADGYAKGGETYDNYLAMRNPLDMRGEEAYNRLKSELNERMDELYDMDESELADDKFFQTLRRSYIDFRNKEGSSVRELYDDFLPKVDENMSNEELRDVLMRSLNDFNQFSYREMDYRDIDILNPFIKALGYDGVIREYDKNGQNKGSEYITFDSNQIKSATGNEGTYSPTWAPTLRTGLTTTLPPTAATWTRSFHARRRLRTTRPTAA